MALYKIIFLIICAAGAAFSIYVLVSVKIYFDKLLAKRMRELNAKHAKELLHHLALRDRLGQLLKGGDE